MSSSLTSQVYRRRAGTVTVAASAALLILAIGGCDDAKDAASSATSAAASAVADATGEASSAVTAGAQSSSAPGKSGVLGSPTASAPPAPAVRSTSVATPGGGAVSITDSAIVAEYAARGYDKGYLGKPLGPLVTLSDGGKFETFEGGSIYYNPALKKAFTVHGAIGGFWGTSGHETGTLGYPAGEEAQTDRGLQQRFDRGTLLDSDGVVTTISN